MEDYAFTINAPPIPLDDSYTLEEDAELAVTSPRTWETGLAGMPTAGFGMGTAAIDGIVYATGGNVSGGTNVFQAYDPASHTWTTLPTLPQTANGPATVALDGELYAIGGWGPSVPRNTVQIYSPTTNAWRSGTALSFYSGCNQAGVIDGKIYLLTACDGYGGFRQRLDRFDPATNSWTQLADSPHVHSGAGRG